MALITVNMIAWALEAEESMKKGSTTLYGGLADYLVRLVRILDSQIDLIRTGELSTLQKSTIAAFITQDIHNRDVI